MLVGIQIEEDDSIKCRSSLCELLCNCWLLRSDYNSFFLQCIHVGIEGVLKLEKRDYGVEET